MRKYGRHALVVYLLLSAVDLSIAFGLVHTVGADKISIAKDWIEDRWASATHGAVEAEKIRIEREDQERTERVHRAEAEEDALKRGNKRGGLGSPLFWAEFALAYTIHKTAFLPVRVGLTVAWTPKVVAWLTRRGWIGKVGKRGLLWGAPVA
jgi:hypothetical protein